MANKYGANGDSDFRDNNFRQDLLERVLSEDLRARIHPIQMRKAAVVVCNMQQHKFSPSAVNDVCWSMFVDQSDVGMQRAWRVFDADGSGSVDLEEFREALPLLGEDLQLDRIDQLFAAADEDGSGTMEFDEFSALIRHLNPGIKSLQELTGSQTLQQTVASTLDAQTKCKLPKTALKRCGAVIQNMVSAGYQNKQIQAVIIALFIKPDLRSMRIAWDVFACDRRSLSEVEFRKIMMLLGEGKSETELNEMYQSADADGSGQMEFDEFALVARALNPVSKTGRVQQKHIDPMAKAEAQGMGEMTAFLDRCFDVLTAERDLKIKQTVTFLAAQDLTSVAQCVAKTRIGLEIVGVMPTLAHKIIDEGVRWQLHSHLAKSCRIMNVKVMTAQQKAQTARLNAQAHAGRVTECCTQTVQKRTEHNQDPRNLQLADVTAVTQANAAADPYLRAWRKSKVSSKQAVFSRDWAPSGPATNPLTHADFRVCKLSLDTSGIFTGSSRSRPVSRALAFELGDVRCPRSSTAPEGGQRVKREANAVVSRVKLSDLHDATCDGDHESCSLKCGGTPWRGEAMVRHEHESAQKKPAKADLSISDLKCLWGFQ